MKQIGIESKAFSLLVLFRIAAECHLKNDISSAPLGIVTVHRPRKPSVVQGIDQGNQVWN